MNITSLNASDSPLQQSKISLSSVPYMCIKHTDSKHA